MNPTPEMGDGMEGVPAASYGPSPSDVSRKTIPLALVAIVIDPALYPRAHESWQTVARYVAVLISGGTLPAIVIGWRDGKPVLLDGRHRYRALAHVGIETTEVIESTAEPHDFFLEAVRLNACHGRPFTTEERHQNADRLAALGYDARVIETALAAPITELRAPTISRATQQAVSTVQTPVAAASTTDREQRARNRKITLALTALGEAFAEEDFTTVDDTELEAWITRWQFVGEQLAEERKRRRSSQREGA